MARSRSRENSPMYRFIGYKKKIATHIIQSALGVSENCKCTILCDIEMNSSNTRQRNSIRVNISK